MNSITSHLVKYPACCDLAYPEKAQKYFSEAPVVDSLDHYTTSMWDILTDVVIWEWNQIRLPSTGNPWGHPVHVPAAMRILMFLERTHARKMQNEIQGKYLARVDPPDRMSMFKAYGLQVPQDRRREHEGMEFLARQANHLLSHDNYLLIVQDLNRIM